jgi:hypothetical protein
MESIFHRDEKDVAAALILIQRQMQKGIPHAAAATLEKLFRALKDASEVKYAPGLVSLAVRLFPQVGKEEKANTILTEAKTYWSSKDTLVRTMLRITLMTGSQYRHAGQLCNSSTGRQSLNVPTVGIAFSRDGYHAI